MCDSGFICNDKNEWIKINYPNIVSTNEIRIAIDQDEIFKCMPNALTSKIISELKTSSKNRVLLADVEKTLWPLKLISPEINNIIIAIKPGWARDLFDEDLADADLFGARVDLALQQEGVYYRANSPFPVTAPSRILWYVCKDNKHYGCGSIRACSILDEVIIGKPKDLYKQYKKYGVYTWDDVYSTAKCNIDNEIMAIKFSHTELFKKPLEWSIFQEILRSHGTATQIQSPTKITNPAFLEIYEKVNNV